jgi:hypothetical protein
MPSLGVELLSKKVADRLLVRDLIEAPEKFTDEEIGIIKSYHPTDIDFDTKGLPQEAFWYISLDKVLGQYCNIRFGKRYMSVEKMYSWYVYIEGMGPKGRFGFEETTAPADLPLNIEAGISLLKKYLDQYQIMEAVEVNQTSEDDKIKYKKDLESLYKTVSRAWNFLHEASQEFQFNEIGEQLTSLEKKFPNRASQIKRLESKMAKIRSSRMQFEDAYYQLKSEVARFIK